MREVLFEGFERLSYRLQEGLARDTLARMADEAGDAPAGGLDALGLAYPTQLFLDPPGGGGEQVGGLEFGQRRRLLGRQPAVGGLEHGPSQRLGHPIVRAIPKTSYASLLFRLILGTSYASLLFKGRIQAPSGVPVPSGVLGT